MRFKALKKDCPVTFDNPLYFSDKKGTRGKDYFHLSRHMPSSLSIDKSKNKSRKSFNMLCDFTIEKDNIFLKDDNLIKMNRLSIEETRARFYQNQLKERNLNEQRNFYLQKYRNRVKELKNIESQIQSGIASEREIKDSIDNFFENISTTTDSLKFVIDYHIEKRDKKNKIF
jgi:hypothetical protein